VDLQRPAADGERRSDDSLTAALTNAVIGVMKEYVGRGPTKGRAYVRDDVVVVILGETLTKAERTLVRDGKAERVLAVRQDFQRTMRDALVEEVERLTGRTVIAFMSDNHIEPELACEIFLLEPTRGKAPG